MSTLAMNLTSIDTLAFSKRMQKAGLAQKTADELAEALKETHSQSIENFATKSDLENKIDKSESKLEQKIDLVRKDVEMVRKELQLSIESTKSEIIVRIGRAIYLAAGLIISAIGISIAILKF